MMEHKRRKNHGNGANERRNFAVMMGHETNFREMTEHRRWKSHGNGGSERRNLPELREHKTDSGKWRNIKAGKNNNIKA